MINYRRGSIFGLTVAEMFILLTFLLLIALLGLIQSEEPDSRADENIPARVWVRPEELVTLFNEAKMARTAKELTEKALKDVEAAQLETEQKYADIERERDHALEAIRKLREVEKNFELARTAAEIKLKEAETARQEAEQKYADIERERDQALEEVENVRGKTRGAELSNTEIQQKLNQANEIIGKLRKDNRKAELARSAAEKKLNQALKEAHEVQELAQEEVSTIRLERDQARQDLELFRHKGENPPCWYEIVDDGGGKKRERALYVFKVAIFDDWIELGKLKPPPGGADDDGDRTYADEWTQLKLGYLPYGEQIDNSKFEEIGRNLKEKGQNRQVRTYKCVFSVRVWDKTSEDNKKRWKNAHDVIIEQYFGAYTMIDDKWEAYE